MSVPAPSPAASPAPGPSSTTSSTGASAVDQGAHAHAAATGFEALLAAFFGAQNATGAAGDGPSANGPFLLNKLAGKVAAGDKATGPDGKAKEAGDGKADDAAAAAGATADAAQGLVPPSVAALVLVTTPTIPAAAQGVEAAPAGGSQATMGKAAGQAAAATLAKLAGETAAGDPGSAKSDAVKAQVANAVATTAADAVATAKATTPTAPQADTPAAAPALAASPPPPAPIPAPPASAATLPTAAATPIPATAAPAPAPAKAQPAAATATAQGDKAARVDGVRAEAAPSAGASAKAANALQPGIEGLAKGQQPDVDPQAPRPDDGKPDPATGPQTTGGLDTAATTTPATLAQAAAVAVRGAPQTVANLAAQIAKKLDGRSTRFDVQLDPAGLGKVDVRVEIGGDGKMSASMAFDNPQAAADLKSRAGELQRALEQSGFDLSGGLSFDVAADSGQGHQPQGQDTSPNTGAAFRGRAFQAALDTGADAAPASQLMYRRSSASGVDIRI